MGNKHNIHRFIPLILSIGIAIGIVVGDLYRNYFTNPNLSVISASGSKITDVLMLINDHYVEDVDIPELVEGAIPRILSELDPHSTYSSAEDVERDMQNLEGHFSGIGIQFFVYRDTVNVVKVISVGPSDGKNIKAGDRIIAVNGENITGEKSANDSVMKKLKGPKGTEANLRLLRYEEGRKQEFDLKITRGDVPINSIDVCYMIGGGTGYMQISSFGNTTYNEFLLGMKQLEDHGMTKLVLDLRGNLGGYLDAAVQIANEFLPDNRLIVYIEGRKTPRQNFKSDGHGSYQNLPLVVLVDEYSASASEVLAGAMQDNDRAEIIGRRTFGKGLVQEPFKLRDGSVIRLTKARYYAPSGRCLQKPYSRGESIEKYEMDMMNRELSGELFSADSIKTNGKAYTTRSGREVYGGGGVTPDQFVALDTIGYSQYYRDAASRGLLQQFAYEYVDQHRKQLLQLRSLSSYLQAAGLAEQFARYAERQGLRRTSDYWKSSKLIQRSLVSIIIDDAAGVKAATMYRNENDPTVQTALKYLEKK